MLSKTYILARTSADVYLQLKSIYLYGFVTFTWPCQSGIGKWNSPRTHEMSALVLKAAGVYLYYFLQYWKTPQDR